MSHTHYSLIWIVCGVRATHHRAVAERREEDEMAISMRRIILVLAVAAVMAAMVAGSAATALAEEIIEDPWAHCVYEDTDYGLVYYCPSSNYA